MSINRVKLLTEIISKLTNDITESLHRALENANLETLLTKNDDSNVNQPEDPHVEAEEILPSENASTNKINEENNPEQRARSIKIIPNTFQTEENENSNLLPKRGRPRKQINQIEISKEPPKQRGRPRKIKNTDGEIDNNNQAENNEPTSTKGKPSTINSNSELGGTKELASVTERHNNESVEELNADIQYLDQVIDSHPRSRGRPRIHPIKSPKPLRSVGRPRIHPIKSPKPHRQRGRPRKNIPETDVPNSMINFYSETNKLSTSIITEGDNVKESKNNESPVSVPLERHNPETVYVSNVTPTRLRGQPQKYTDNSKKSSPSFKNSLNKSTKFSIKSKSDEDPLSESLNSSRDLNLTTEHTLNVLGNKSQTKSVHFDPKLSLSPIVIDDSDESSSPKPSHSINETMDGIHSSPTLGLEISNVESVSIPTRGRPKKIIDDSKISVKKRDVQISSINIPTSSTNLNTMKIRQEIDDGSYQSNKEQFQDYNENLEFEESKSNEQTLSSKKGIKRKLEQSTSTILKKRKL